MLPIVLWKWGSKFSVDHVHRARNMLARHLHMPHEVVCVTDDPSGIDNDIRTIPLWSDLRHYGRCLVRLKAFHPSMAEVIGPRFAWMDLDMVITDDVTPIFSRTEDFVISGVELRPQPYNGSLVLMTAGCRERVFRTFNYDHLVRERRRLNYGGSDQAWIAIALGPHEATWTTADGVYTYRDYVDGATLSRRHSGRYVDEPCVPTRGALPSGCRIIVMNGRYDPSHQSCRLRSPWIREYWR